MRFWKSTFLSVCLSENKFTHRDPGEPCLKGVTVQNMPGWEGNYFLDGKSDNGHPVYVANSDERFLYVIETFGIKKWHFSYLPGGKGAYAWGNFEKNCPFEVRRYRSYN